MVLKYTHKIKNVKKVKGVDQYNTIGTIWSTNGTIATNDYTNCAICNDDTICCRETFRVPWLPLVLMAPVVKCVNGTIGIKIK